MIPVHMTDDQIADGLRGQSQPAHRGRRRSNPLVAPALDLRLIRAPVQGDNSGAISSDPGIEEELHWRIAKRVRRCGYKIITFNPPATSREENGVHFPFMSARCSHSTRRPESHVRSAAL